MALATAATAVAILSLPARAASPPLSLSVAPGDVTLRPGTTTQVALLLRNDDSGDVIQFNKLDALQPDGVHLDGLAEAPLTLPAHATTSVILTLVLDAFSLGGSVVIRASYTIAGAADEIATATIGVHADGAASLDSLVSTDVHSPSGSVDQNTDGAMVLLVHNKGAVPLEVTGINVATTASELKVTGNDPRFPVTVSPLDTAVFPYTARIDGRTRAGKQMVTFSVEVVMPPVLPKQVRVVATQDVDVQVFGESALLAAAAVPSLLVLPGFLLVATLGFLAKQVSPRVSAHVPDPNTPYFWLLAVSASLLAMFPYRAITGRWYFDSYNFNDIVVLWFVSLGIGLVVFGIWWLADELYTRSRVVEAGDEALDVLRKMAHADASPYVRAGQVAGYPKTMAVLPFLVDGDDKRRWVAPMITALVEVAKVQEVNTALTKKSQDVLDAVRKKARTVKWSEDGVWPQQVDAAAAATATGNLPLVDVQAL